VYTVCGCRHRNVGPRQLSRYTDSLQAGRSGDRILVEARFSAPVQTSPGAHPASCTMGTGSFPGIRRTGRGVDHPPPPSAEVKERVQLYLYTPSGSFPGIKRTGRGVDHPPPSSAEVKERVQLYLYTPSGSSWPVRGWPSLLLYRVLVFSEWKCWAEITKWTALSKKETCSWVCRKPRQFMYKTWLLNVNREIDIEK
jgi:hypothetical protein